MTLLGRVRMLMGVTILATRLCSDRLFRLPLHRRVVALWAVNRRVMAFVTVLTGSVLMHGTFLVSDMILGWEVIVNNVWTLEVATLPVCRVQELT